MKIIIGGAGQVGFHIAQQLSSEGHDIVVIDSSPELVKQISDSLDVQALVGHASHPDTLDRAGAADIDMLKLSRDWALRLIGDKPDGEIAIAGHDRRPM